MGIQMIVSAMYLEDYPEYQHQQYDAGTDHDALGQDEQVVVQVNVPSDTYWSWEFHTDKTVLQLRQCKRQGKQEAD